MKSRKRKLLLSIVGACALIMSSVSPAIASTSISYNLGGNMVYGSLTPSSGGTSGSYASTSFSGTGAVEVTVTYNYRFGALEQSAFGSNGAGGPNPTASAYAVPTLVPAVALSSSGTHFASDGSGSWNGNTSG